MMKTLILLGAVAIVLSASLSPLSGETSDGRFRQKEIDNDFGARNTERDEVLNDEDKDIESDGYREYKHESDEEDGEEEEDTDLANDSDGDYFNEDAREEKIEDDDAEDDEYKNGLEENSKLQMASDPVPLPHRRFRWSRRLRRPRRRFRWPRCRCRWPRRRWRWPRLPRFRPSRG